jgi:hypothetical protein
MKRKSANSPSIYGRDVRPRKCLFCESTYPEWWHVTCGSLACEKAWDTLLGEATLLFPFNMPEHTAMFLYEQRKAEAEHLAMPTQWDHLSKDEE